MVMLYHVLIIQKLYYVNNHGMQFKHMDQHVLQVISMQVKIILEQQQQQTLIHHQI